jgi:hypothetical protein
MCTSRNSLEERVCSFHILLGKTVWTILKIRSPTHKMIHGHARSWLPYVKDPSNCRKQNISCFSLIIVVWGHGERWKKRLDSRRLVCFQIESDPKSASWTSLHILLNEVYDGDNICLPMFNFWREMIRKSRIIILSQRNVMFRSRFQWP